MKFPVSRPVFPDFQFTEENEREVVSLVDALVDKLMEGEQQFFGNLAGLVDETNWKQLGQSEGVFVYGERKGTAPVDGAIIDQAVRPFVVFGAIPGDLDDVLYNFTTPSRKSTLMKTSYIDDGVVDVEVLHQVYGPTETDPFRHLTIKWAVVASHFQIIRARDFVVVDTVDTRVLSDGERIGYRVTHSIELPGASSLEKHGFIRGNLSICSVFRRGEFGQVHVYGRVFSDPRGDIPKSVFVKVGAAQVTSSAATMMNEQMKKLVFALRSSEHNAWVVSVPCETDSQTCGVCRKTLHFLNKSRSKCALCSRDLCRSCCVNMQLSYLDATFATVKVKTTFCCFCVQQATSAPSAVAAKAEFLSAYSDFYEVPAHARGRSASMRKLSQAVRPKRFVRRAFSLN